MDGRTDGQTDGQIHDDSIYSDSIVSRVTDVIRRNGDKLSPWAIGLRGGSGEGGRICGWKQL